MITEFKNGYRWLSNFYPCEIQFGDYVYPTVEHAYQSAKSNDDLWKQYCVQELNPVIIKKESKLVKLVYNWESIKVNVMWKCINRKYNKEPFKQLLIDTKKELLVEGNNWGDEFWGVNLKTGKGKNVLGKLLMRKRKELTK